jgi:hypothetical protein
MDVGLSKVVSGLPAFLGVCVGIRTYENRWPFFAIIMFALAVAVMFLLIGRSIIHRHPLRARWLIEFWIVSAICMVAFATSAALWAALSPLSPLLADVAGQERDTISATFIGAVTAYFAFAWTKEIGEARGFFWPSTQFKSALEAAGSRLPVKLPMDSSTTDAVFNNHIQGEGVEGWSFKARGVRARIVAQWIRDAKPYAPLERGTD